MPVLDGLKIALTDSIKETLRNRNHGLVYFDTSITNNWIDDADNEQITGYSIR
jgi:hypothetical protein